MVEPTSTEQVAGDDPPVPGGGPAPGGPRSSRLRVRTPAGMYGLISNPVLRAILGWDMACRDVRWLPVLPVGTYLEVGSGGGFYTGALARRLPSTTTLLTLDPDPGSLAALRDRPAGGPTATLRQIAGDGTRLPLGTSTVDVLLLGYCLEEMHDPEAAVAEAHRVLRPDGRIVVFLWRPAITRRRRRRVVAGLRELFEVEQERFGPQNVRLRYRR